MQIAKNKMNRNAKFNILLLLIIFFLELIFPIGVKAAVSKPTFTASLRKDRRAVIVNFANLNTTTKVSYELTYFGNGLDQGVVGSIYQKEGNSASRTLLFGTCSKKVCTYHKNIKNAQLKITAKLKSGQTYIKTFKIKV